MDNFISLLQFADGLFPAGAYAHSFGLEHYVQSGRVSGPDEVEQFLRAYLAGSMAPTDTVAALCAQSGAEGEDLPACIALDEMLDAMKAASELRDASLQMGRQTLRVANDLGCGPILADFARAVAEGRTPGHHPVVFGVVGAAMQWLPVETASALLYSASAALVGAALRLLPLGQLAGQRILRNIRPLIATLALEEQGKTAEAIWSFAPALEVASMRHATLDARLFRS